MFWEHWKEIEPGTAIEYFRVAINLGDIHAEHSTIQADLHLQAAASHIFQSKSQQLYEGLMHNPNPKTLPRPSTSTSNSCHKPEILHKIMVSNLNLPGAIIFWSYILAALLFTSIAITLILRQKSPPQNRNHVYLFATLALISFSAISFNMLHVLIKSYTLWSDKRWLGLQSTWTWSTHSTLFQDFGNEIVATDERFIWTRSALWMTLGVCVWMGVEGEFTVCWIGLDVGLCWMFRC